MTRPMRRVRATATGELVNSGALSGTTAKSARAPEACGTYLANPRADNLNSSESWPPKAVQTLVTGRGRQRTLCHPTSLGYAQTKGASGI